MENASKAIIISGSILITTLILSTLFAIYSYLQNANNENSQNRKVIQAVEFNKKFEEYNKDLVYGSDILSLINLIKDYNIQEFELKNYEDIEISITISNQTEKSNYFTKGTYGLDEIYSNYTNLESQIQICEQKKYLNSTRTIDYFIKLNEEEISGLIDKYADDLRNIRTEIDEYNNLISERDEFKVKKFKCTNVIYSGERIVKMIFKEK